MTADFTMPVDSKGLVIYFGINGSRFLYNGHAGIFEDELPEWGWQALDALAKPQAEQVALFRRFYREHGDEAKRFITDLRLFSTGFHPDLAAEPRRESFAPGLHPRIFNVFLSHGCNLECRYCINQQGTFGRDASIMSAETAREVVAYIGDIARSGRHSTLSVNLFGGEPLMAPDAARIIAGGLQDLNHQKLKTRIHLLLSTNGTIYDKKIFDIFAECPDLSSIVVSLDGDRDLHDSNRPFAGGAGSYDLVLGNLREMMRNMIPYSVTCVVSPPHRFIEAATELHRLGLKRVEIKPLIHHIYGGDLPERFEREFSAWRENYLAYTDWYLDYLDSAEPVKHVDRVAVFGDCAKAIGTTADPPTTLACGLVEAKIGILADGAIVPCESLHGRKEFELGNVRAGFDSENRRRFEEWIFSGGQHRIDVEKCRNCFAKRLCGGGCYAVTHDKSGGLSPYDDETCLVIREQMKIDLYYLSRMKKRHPERFAAISGDGGRASA